MPNQKNKNEQRKKSTGEFSGSIYHKEHASNIPDYGANSMDPNARGHSNTTE